MSSRGSVLTIVILVLMAVSIIASAVMVRAVHSMKDSSHVNTQIANQNLCASAADLAYSEMINSSPDFRAARRNYIGTFGVWGKDPITLRELFKSDMNFFYDIDMLGMHNQNNSYADQVGYVISAWSTREQNPWETDSNAKLLHNAATKDRDNDGDLDVLESYREFYPIQWVNNTYGVFNLKADITKVPQVLPFFGINKIKILDKEINTSYLDKYFNSYQKDIYSSDIYDKPAVQHVFIDTTKEEWYDSAQTLQKLADDEMPVLVFCRARETTETDFSRYFLVLRKWDMTSKTMEDMVDATTSHFHPAISPGQEFIQFYPGTRYVISAKFNRENQDLGIVGAESIDGGITWNYSATSIPKTSASGITVLSKSNIQVFAPIISESMMTDASDQWTFDTSKYYAQDLVNNSWTSSFDLESSISCNLSLVSLSGNIVLDEDFLYENILKYNSEGVTTMPQMGDVTIPAGQTGGSFIIMIPDLWTSTSHGLISRLAPDAGTLKIRFDATYGGLIPGELQWMYYDATGNWVPLAMINPGLDDIVTDNEIEFSYDPADFTLLNGNFAIAAFCPVAYDDDVVVSGIEFQALETQFPLQALVIAPKGNLVASSSMYNDGVADNISIDLQMYGSLFEKDCLDLVNRKIDNGNISNFRLLFDPYLKKTMRLTSLAGVDYEDRMVNWVYGSTLMSPTETVPALTGQALLDAKRRWSWRVLALPGLPMYNEKQIWLD